jgi:alkanesulfonate monooxygenase SsuD/methylene tetrahydromethanopterin reductase-like flavin-dependent oxidoreductase (luciferase family)
MDRSRRRPLKVGLMLPTVDDWMAGCTARWTDLVAMARRAEDVGFDSLWMPDHLIYEFGDPGEPRHGLWEAWSLLAALAAATTRIELGPLVACTGFRNPALLAKMADTVDEISGGRLVLGLGAGYHGPEYRAFGYPFDHLVGHFEEALRVIHTLLREGRIDFAGTYYEARECELRPRGPRPTGPPLLIGALAHAPRMLRLTAHYADLWNAWSVNRSEDVGPLREAVDAACRKAGREPSTLGRTVSVLVDLPAATAHPQANWVTRFRAAFAPPVSGSPEELAERLRAFAREGIGHVQVYLEPSTVAGIEAFAPTLALLDRGQVH